RTKGVRFGRCVSSAGGSQGDVPGNRGVWTVGESTSRLNRVLKMHCETRMFRGQGIDGPLDTAGGCVGCPGIGVRKASSAAAQTCRTPQFVLETATFSVLVRRQSSRTFLRSKTG